MPKQSQAIATCRVSSVEQLESNSLNRQEQSVRDAARYLGVTIPADGIWSGSVSSKSGRNYSRKDLSDMLVYCKRHPNVKYLIVDEIDRFMRSLDEMFYFEVLFRQKVGVKIWYAGDPALNSDDPFTKLRRAMEAFKAEGSNLERQNKSIKGQVAALQQGRFPFCPKPGYKRGYERGIPEIHPTRGPALKEILIKVATRRVTPSQGLVELNRSQFMVGHALYKMDKFRKIVTDPFYAGIVEIDKQVKLRNENGLHEPLITKEQHLRLLQIMHNKPKTQSGPCKNGNPKYPLSNLVTCVLCEEKRNGRLVGYDHGNGKKNSPVYEKYRCRSCYRYRKRSDIHQQVEQYFQDRPITQEGLRDFLWGLHVVWKQGASQTEQAANRIRHRIASLKATISQQAEAAIDPSNSAIKPEILASIAKKKTEVADLENQLAGLRTEADNNKDHFLKYAFGFIEHIGSNFLNTSVVSKENRLRCKQIVFPGGLYLDAKNKVYTPEMSELFRLATRQKGASAPSKTHLVHQIEKSLHLIRGEIARWRQILEVPYEDYTARTKVGESHECSMFMSVFYEDRNLNA